MKDEMDILREVGSIAAAHGSIALSEMLGAKINLEVPSLDIIPAELVVDKLSKQKIAISVCSQMLSGLKGNILFLLDENSSFKIIDICYKLDEKDKKSGVLTEMGISALKEIGSVVIASYVVALSMILKRVIIPSVPTLLNGPIDQIMNMAIAPLETKDYLLLIEAVFKETEHDITGCFYLILNPRVMKDIKTACEKLLKEIKNK